jgi:hypothetical protein
MLASNPDPTPPLELPVFAERFALGVCTGSAVVSVFHLESWWAASLAFSGFVLYLVLRWARLVRDPQD